MKGISLGNDASAEKAQATYAKVNPLLYGEGDVPNFNRIEIVALWDGYEGCWNYHFADGSYLEKYTAVDDHGQSVTAWTLYPATAAERVA
jgi:hypothetical protein